MTAPEGMTVGDLLDELLHQLRRNPQVTIETPVVVASRGVRDAQDVTVDWCPSSTRVVIS